MISQIARISNTIQIVRFFALFSIFLCTMLWSTLPQPTYAQDGCTSAPIESSLLSTLGSATVGNNPIAAQTQTQQAIQATICQPIPRIKIPGLSFTSSTDIVKHISVNPQTGETTLYIPFLGEYIAVIYRYGVALAGVVCILLIIISGIQWTLYGASPDNVDAAKERITHSLTGLIIIVSSYTILYTIDPTLVEFKHLKLTLITKEIYEYPDENDDPTPLDQISQSNQVNQTQTSGLAKRLCSSVAECTPICNNKASWSTQPDTQGMLPKNRAVPIPSNIPGVRARNGLYVDPSLIQPITDAGAEAQKRGYTLYITSGYRSLETQIEKACEKINSGNFNPRTLAWPGGSNHGRGIAIDVVLQKEGKSITVVGNTAKQNLSMYQPNNRILAEIMYTTGWKRLKTEIWHFEFPNTPVESTRVVNGCYDTSC